MGEPQQSEDMFWEGVEKKLWWRVSCGWEINNIVGFFLFEFCNFYYHSLISLHEILKTNSNYIYFSSLLKYILL